MKFPRGFIVFGRKVDYNAEGLIWLLLFLIVIHRDLFELILPNLGAVSDGIPVLVTFFLIKRRALLPLFLLSLLFFFNSFLLSLFLLLARFIGIYYIILNLKSLRFIALFVAVLSSTIVAIYQFSGVNVFMLGQELNGTSWREFSSGWISGIFANNISLAYFSMILVLYKRPWLLLLSLLFSYFSGSLFLLTANVILVGLIYLKGMRFLGFTLLVVSLVPYVYFMFWDVGDLNSFKSSRGGMLVLLFSVLFSSNWYELLFGYNVKSDEEFFTLIMNGFELPAILLDDQNTAALGDVYLIYAPVRIGFVSILLLFWFLKASGLFRSRSELVFFPFGLFNQWLVDLSFQFFHSFYVIRTREKKSPYSK